MSFPWFRRRSLPPAGPNAVHLEEYLAAKRSLADAFARMDATVNNLPYIPTRPGTDHAALVICNRIYASGTAKRRNTRKENP